MRDIFKEKQILTVAFVVPLTVMSLVACGAKGNDKVDEAEQVTSTESSQQVEEKEEVKEESKETKADTPDKAFDGILGDIQADFSETIGTLNTELQNVYSGVGETYDDYVKNKSLINDWYTLALDESQKLFDRTNEKSVEYYKWVATEYADDYSEADKAMNDYFQAVYNGVMDDYFQAVYNDAMDELFQKYYNGIIDDGYDSAEYAQWSDESSQFYRQWSDASSAFYQLWSEEGSDIYRRWSAVSSGFFADNYDVDAIMKEYEEKQSAETGNTDVIENAEKDGTDEADQSDETGETAASTEVTPELKAFLDEYEAFFDEYIEFMKKYNSSGDTVSLMSDYLQMLEKYTSFTEAVEKYDSDEMSDADRAYYIEVTTRVSKKLLEAVD